jgi:tetratricopeptide (TPR) repeat protein
VAVASVAGATLAGLLGVFTQGAASSFWAAACLVAGGTIGFLFGIPRTLQNEQPGSPQAGAGEGSGYEQRVNTNLEQISDWLTKILVGLGLTQLQRVPDLLYQAARYMASGMPNQEAAITFSSATIVYFSIVGFIGGYLVTRLYLAGAFREADVGGLSKRIDLVAERVEQVSETTSEVQVQTLVESALRDLRRSAPEPTLQERIRSLERYRVHFPANRRLHMVLNRLYEAVGQRDEAIEVLSTFLKDKAQLGQANDKDTADALYNRACDYAQKTTEVPEPEREKYVKLALQDLRRSLQLSPVNAVEARTDSYFAPIRDTEEFRQLLAS